MSDPMRDYLEERESTLEKRIAELEAALFQIIAAPIATKRLRDIAREALGLEASPAAAVLDAPAPRHRRAD